jgi:hypothetical protein
VGGTDLVPFGAEAVHALLHLAEVAGSTDEQQVAFLITIDLGERQLFAQFDVGV